MYCPWLLYVKHFSRTGSGKSLCSARLSASRHNFDQRIAPRPRCVIDAETTSGALGIRSTGPCPRNPVSKHWQGFATFRVGLGHLIVAADQRKAINRFQFHANGNDWPCALFRVDLNQALDFSLTPPEKEPGSSRNCRKSSGSFIAMDVDRHLALVIISCLIRQSSQSRRRLSAASS